MLRTMLPWLAPLVVLAHASRALGADEAAVRRALALVPDDAISFIAVPSIKAASDDLSQLVEATGQGGLLAMGRPIDLLKAQLGVGANLDEKGPLALYYREAADPAATRRLPVAVVPVTDAAAFLAANLTPAPDKGEGAFTTADGTVFFARALGAFVALAPTAAELPAALPERGIADRFAARLQPAESAWLARADLVAWGSRTALEAAAREARAQPIGPQGGFPGLDAQQEAVRQRSLDIAGMLAEGLVVLDIDPLGIYLASLGVAQPGTPLAAVMSGGEGRSASFDRLPSNPFYLALAADVDGLGGAARLGELMDLAGLPRTTLPAWVFEEGADIRSIQLGAYPSKLGVAIGGAFNDSALFIGSRDPARTLARVRQSIEALAGESDGLRREPSWNPEKKLKSGEQVIAFEVKETVVDAAKRPPLDYERLAKQFTFGSRGLNGLVKQREDGLVFTFSQRPDVYGRAVEAAAGTKGLSTDDTVRSIEEWLPAQRDVEVMVGVGPLVGLVGQIASSFVSEEQVRSMLPAVDRDAAPVAIAAEIGAGRAAVVTVIPAEVLKIAASAGARRDLPAAPPASAAPGTAP